MPLYLFRAYARMLPQLRAEDALMGVSQTMIGTGSMEKRSADRILGDWRYEAEGPRPKVVITSEEDRIAQAGLGGMFDVEVVPNS